MFTYGGIGHGKQGGLPGYGLVDANGSVNVNVDVGANGSVNVNVDVGANVSVDVSIDVDVSVSVTVDVVVPDVVVHEHRP